MAVMAREAWTDGRLDDLNERVNLGFGEMRSEFRAVRTDVKAELGSMRQEISAMREEMHSEIGAMREEIAALNRTIHQFTIALVGVVFLGFMGTIAAIVTLV